MRKSRFTDEQMVAILREADLTSVAEAATKNQVSEQTIYAWRDNQAGDRASLRWVRDVGAHRQPCSASRQRGR